MQTVAYEIIDHIANFEDELKKIFEKPKFVLGTNYVISLDKLDNGISTPLSNLVIKIKNHKNYSKQLAEWQELGFVDDNFDIEELEDKYKHLPLDTKYFEDIKHELLSGIEDLDNSLNGILIKSENYQAMQTILPKFKEKIQCIYIDPPFNTGSDFDYKDGYQDSTWLSIMYDRLAIARDFLRDDGSLYLHLDYRANYRGRELLNNTFGCDHLLNEVVYGYRIQGIKRNAYANKHDTIYIYTKSKPDENKHYFQVEKERQIYNKPFIDTETISPEISSLTDKDFKYLIDSILNKKVLKDRYKDLLFNSYYSDTFVRDVWDHDKTKPLISGSSEYLQFKTQKSQGLLSRVISNSSKENHCIMDFFSGSGTTVATAHKLGRKWLGIEMGEHFDNVIIPRMKKVLFGFECGISKELKKEDKLTVGGIFKYYELEQYEDTLSKASYEKLEEKSKTLIDLTKEDKQNFANISFENNEKLAKDGLEIGKEEIFYRFEKLYPNVDIFECLSNFKGWDIYQIKSANEVVFKADGKLKTVHKKI